MRVFRSSATLARAAVVVLAILCAQPVLAAEPVLWKENASVPVAPELARFNDLLSQLAERLKPALVQVRVGRSGSSASGDKPEPPNEARRGTGSGFFIHDSGLLVTNAHVVDGSDSIQVRLANGRRYAGKVIGRDNRVDLALVKIDGAADLPVLQLGDSNRVRVGEFVLALGHPFGLEQTVSFGIVSRKGAPLSIAAPGFDFIQTDAAINPGNSGGPLINMAGQVGCANSTAVPAGSLGLAIPSNPVQQRVPPLCAEGPVQSGWLGVSIAEITDEDVPRLKLREPRGVLIPSVIPREPADQGGGRPTDVILALDGTPLDGPRDLQRVVPAAPVGKKMRVTVWRDGHQTEVEVTIGRYKAVEDQ